MKLTSLEIKPKNNSGWGSPKLFFGEEITQLYANNGSGKTPLIQSIVFCLGYPIEFREDIVRHCLSANLSLIIGGDNFTFIRLYDSKFDITIRKNDSQFNRFYSESDFSKFLLPLLGYSQERLITNGNTPTLPYTSTLLPIFYLDQDRGYSEYYFPPSSSFIKNQFSEMVRIAAGFAPLQSYDRKEKTIEIKERVKYLDQSVVESRRQLSRLRDDLATPNKSISEIEHEVENLKGNLNELKNTKDIKSEALNSFDLLIYNLKSQHREACSQERELKSRISSSNSIKLEIESEIETLNLNEESLSAFTTLSEICSSPNCGMFFASSESYGKSLLYLRDQIKDLAISTANNQRRLDIVSAEKSILEQSIQTLSNERGEAVAKEGIDLFIKAISNISSKIFDLELEKSKHLRLDEQEKNHLNLKLDRDRNVSLEESFLVTRDPSIEILNFRLNLSKEMIKWLDILRSVTISRDIKIDSDFKPILGIEKLNVFKGSSKVRAVLAYHAALFSILTAKVSDGFRVLIFDTPRQQELHNEDLDDYMKELKKLATNHNVQIIFSTTSYRYELSKGDTEWTPTFNNFQQPMYLG